MTVTRHALILWSLQALERRIPYVWGGRDAGLGLDCSGFITVALYQLSLGSLDFRATHNTDRLWAELPRIRIGDEQPGDVAVYQGAKSTGPDDVEHVMLHVGAGVVVGQAYGGRANTSREYSIQRGHWTRALATSYRGDLCGFLRLPLLP